MFLRGLIERTHAPNNIKPRNRTGCLRKIQILVPQSRGTRSLINDHPKQRRPNHRHRITGIESQASNFDCRRTHLYRFHSLSVTLGSSQRNIHNNHLCSSTTLRLMPRRLYHRNINSNAHHWASKNESREPRYKPPTSARISYRRGWSYGSSNVIWMRMDES